MVSFELPSAQFVGAELKGVRSELDLLPGRAIVSIEARGWRRSRGLPGPYTLEQLAQDVRDVISDAGLTDYILVGHSAGGKVAQLVAAAPPAGLAGLVLVASVPSKPRSRRTAWSSPAPAMRCGCPASPPSTRGCSTAGDR
jgi:pimeloyl-ACP methyl ester carboxylesterase